ncbi:transporter, anaerobic C4-dicarboxylate uptake C family protein, partial [Vibrio parahaemolyticus SBR10290]
CYR